MSEKNHSQEIKPQAIPVSEVFPSEVEYFQRIREMLDQGSITVSEVQDGESPDAYASVNVAPEELVELPDEPERIHQRDELKLKNPDVIAKREAESVQNAVVDVAGWDEGAYLEIPEIVEDIERGSVSEAFRISNGEASVPILNFTETKLEESNLAEIFKGLQMLLDKTSPAALKELRGILIQSEDRFPVRTIGSMQVRSGIMRLNETLLRGDEKDPTQDKYADIGVSLLAATTTHELAHLLESKAKDKNRKLDYGASTGWVQNPDRYVTDDYGNIVYTTEKVLKMPERRVEMSDGTIMHAVSAYGTDAYLKAAPVTKYGETNEREDLAEASVSYAHGGENLDPIRRDSLEEYYSTLRSDGGTPVPLEVSRLDPSEVKFGQVKPRHIKVKVSYRIAMPGTDLGATPKDPAEVLKMNQQHRWEYTSTTTVDDFGEEIPTRARKLSNWF